VRPGDVVVDIGTGTGLLAYFACQAGASRVFAIEEGPVIALAREIAALNGFSDRVEFFEEHSSRVELPEPADVLISETLWNFGAGEGLVGVLADARERLLKPGAPVMPAAVDLYVAPVQADATYALLSGRPPNRHGIDLSPIRHYQLNSVQMPHLHSDDFVGAPALLVSTDLASAGDPDFEADVRTTVTRDGLLHGICGWFSAQLSAGVVLDNEPPSVKSSWAHAFFPLPRPVPVRPGDDVWIRIQSAAGGTIWRWRTEVHRGGRTMGAFDQSSTDGFPRAAAARPAGD
jgi:protein arginine N-methyltransferase 1